MARKSLPRTALAEAIELDAGETLHGYYRKVRFVDTTHGEQSIHEFELIDPIANFIAGKRVALWGSVVLDDLLSAAVVNVETWVTFKGVQGRTKVFTVDQDPEKLTTPKPAGEGDRLPEDIPF